MIVIPCTQTTYFDIDDTLVMWNPSQAQLERYGIDVKCPESIVYTEDGPVVVGEWTERLVPHRKHVEQLIKHKARGHTIIAWSAGGWEWAEAAIRALQLEKYVDLVIEKPTWIYDDKLAEQFMPKASYMPDYGLNEGPENFSWVKVA